MNVQKLRRSSTRTFEMVLFSVRRNWGERRGLNPRPSVPQTDALPAELRSPPSGFIVYTIWRVLQRHRCARSPRFVPIWEWEAWFGAGLFYKNEETFARRGYV